MHGQMSSNSCMGTGSAWVHACVIYGYNHVGIHGLAYGWDSFDHSVCVAERGVLALDLDPSWPVHQSVCEFTAD